MTGCKLFFTRVLISVAIVITGLGITVAGLYVAKHGSEKNTGDKNTTAIRQDTPKTKPAAHVYSLPKRLIITKLGIDASVLPVGLTPTGAMDSPKTNHDTGWYSTGTRPGNVGSAVIAGHLGLKSDAVFGKLHLLSAGDTLSIVDDQGVKVSFKVVGIRTFGKGSDTTSIFNSQDGNHLNLITCNGDWNSSQKTYDKRLVVFTNKI